MSLNHVSSGHWCKFCKNKTELLVADFLENTYNNIQKQYTTDDYRNTITNNNLFFDFYLPEFNLIIEIDGKQHFENIKGWNSEYGKILQRDVLKMKQAMKNKISVIRLLQYEIWYDKIDWKSLLADNIKLYQVPQIIILANDKGIYDEHLTKFNLLLNEN
jgi:very-short-patch-repair endonuclease